MADDVGTIEALYDIDGVVWAEQQAAALRRRAGAEALDYDNLAEEIEDVGKSITRACESCIDQIIEHLLKLEFAPGSELERDRRGWRVSVLKQRGQLDRALTPTLHVRLPSELPKAYARQLRLLAEGDVLARQDIERARFRTPYTWREITDEHWWPERNA